MTSDGVSRGSVDSTVECLFVYGTLRPNGRAFSLVEPRVVKHEPAVLAGYRLVAEGHRYPWCVRAPDSEVAGDLLWLRDVESALEALDEYEGVHDPDPEYHRVVADVLLGSTIVSAWVYVGGAGTPGDVRPVDGG